MDKVGRETEMNEKSVDNRERDEGKEEKVV